jgi:hypothetical protein
MPLACAAISAKREPPGPAAGACLAGDDSAMTDATAARGGTAPADMDSDRMARRRQFAALTNIAFPLHQDPIGPAARLTAGAAEQFLRRQSFLNQANSSKSHVT